MKRSRSGTRSPRAKQRGPQALGLALALLAVAAFITSFALGLARGSRERPARTVTTAPQPVTVPDSRVRVQVLNGSRTPGLARLATDRLRDAGYDVVTLGNARARVQRSVVLDRVGKKEIAERVARALAIEHVQTEVDTALYLEVTVILGPEWEAPRIDPEPK